MNRVMSDELSDAASPVDPSIMGILNLTPDSFSDGGMLLPTELSQIETHANALLTAGACILDIGGESTRPGAVPVSIDEELSRILPAIRMLSERFPKALLSVDTRHAAVAEAAISSGARMINDISGLTADPAMLETLARLNASERTCGEKLSVIIMHSQGRPETMQTNPQYEDVVEEVRTFLLMQARQLESVGFLRENIWLDPGFGFGKTVAHNLTLLAHLDQLVQTGYPVAVGLSRKSFLTLGKTDTIPPAERDALTAASLVWAIEKGATLLRLHQVALLAPVIRLIARMQGIP